jgi:hypothetical protein
MKWSVPERAFGKISADRATRTAIWCARKALDHLLRRHKQIILLRFHSDCAEAVKLLNGYQAAAKRDKRAYEAALDRLGKEVPHVRCKNGKPIDLAAALAANHTIDSLEYAVKCIFIPTEINDNAYEACDLAYRAVDTLGAEDAKRQIQDRITKCFASKLK